MSKDEKIKSLKDTIQSQFVALQALRNHIGYEEALEIEAEAGNGIQIETKPFVEPDIETKEVV